ILTLVQALGPHLTSADTQSRIEACKLLSNVIQKLPKDCLNQQELASLVEFLCNRLKDHYTLQPVVLDSLLSISSATNLAGENATFIISSIFKEVHVQSCMQNERLKVFQILGTLLDAHSTTVSAIGRDFLYQYIQVIDSEQDPRNLLVIFQLTKNLIDNGFPLYDLTEELFEVSSCYFPIDFNPATAGKKSTITNSDLVIALRGVLASTPDFAPYCIPLLMEKLDSDVESAKIDSIETLTACLICYGKNELETYLSTIWTSLKREINQSTSEDIEKHSLSLLTSLVTNLSNWPVDQKSDKTTDLSSFINDILEDCVPKIKSPVNDRSTWMAGHIIHASAKASKQACSQIVSAVLPLLLRNTSVKETGATLAAPSLEQSALDNLVKLASVCGLFVFDTHPLEKYKAEIFKVFMKILTESENDQMRCIAVAGFAALLKLGILTNDELVELALALYKLMTSDLNSHLRGEVFSVSGFLSAENPGVVKAHLLPCMVNDINESRLDSLAALCTHFDVMKIVLNVIMDKIKGSKINESTGPILHACLNSLESIASSRWLGNVEIEHMALNLVLPLLKYCIEATLEDENFSLECASLPILKSAASVIRHVAQKLKPNKSTELVVKLVTSLYVHDDLGAFDIKTNQEFTPFNPCASPLQTRTLCFLPATVCAMHGAVQVPELVELESKLLNICLNCRDQPSYVFAAKALAGMINKFQKQSVPILDKLKTHLATIFHTGWDTWPSDDKMMVLTLVIWVSKALVISNHPETLVFVKHLLFMLGDSGVGAVAAAGFDIVLRESKEVLCTSSHAVIKLMHKQRFFLLVMPEILSMFKSSVDGKHKANILTALSHLIGHLPKQVVLMQHFNDLLPLLVQALHTEDPALLKSVLFTLCCFIQDSSEAILPHLESLLKHFQRLSKFQNNMAVRAKAIECIGVVTLLPTIDILPYKKEVVSHLMAALDDRKRDVRTEASKARSEWYLVGT
uniref:MMS19 nucleotide excision repair protein n=1 Tax=Ciona savignyi TaxID=51511 RepID=H2ZLN5_CIOSA